MKSTFCAYGLAAIMLPLSASSESLNYDVFSLSLEELLNIEISTGSLVASLAKDSPTAITVIRKEQIAHSPARNLALLLEQYVPGLIVMAHSQGDKIGMRGHIAAENYKLLLLVNGKNVTNMVYEGVISEIDQWNLNDIEKVEVIRGPGSVTYGTGAIAGVINIITKTAETAAHKLSVGTHYDQQFGSSGFNLEFADTLYDWQAYAFVSYQKTEGMKNPNYYQSGLDNNTDVRFIGHKPSDPFGPHYYLQDTYGRPQIKAHLDIKFSDRLNGWARYAQSGQSHAFIPRGLHQNEQGTEQEINRSGVSQRSFISNINYQNQINDDSAWKWSATFDSQEYIRFDLKNPQFAIKSPGNIKDYAFSQNRIVANVFYQTQFSSDLDFILGYELNTIKVASPWGKSDDHLWIREGVHFVSDVNSSVYMNDLTLNSRPKVDGIQEVGSGLRFYTHTNLIETTFNYSDQTKLKYSHRIDIPDISSYMYSPRLSLTSQFDENNTLVISAQRAQRMMPLRAQYLYDKYYSTNGSSNHEKQDSFEISLTNSSIDNTSLNLRTFYNDVQAVGYTGNELAFLNDSSLVGVDLEAIYKLDNLDFQLSHTYLNTLSVEMNQDLKDGNNRNNISFADYDYYTRSDIPLKLTGYGDGLNNVPENVSKFIFNYRMLDGKLIAHANAQIIWSLDGSLDERGMYQAAYDNFDVSTLNTEEQVLFQNQRTEFEYEMALLDEQEAFDLNYNVSASLSYNWLSKTNYDVNVMVYANNIFDSYHRHYVSTGSTRSYPNRLSFMEEPRSFGLKIKVNFK